MSKGFLTTPFTALFQHLEDLSTPYLGMEGAGLSGEQVTQN